MARRFGGRYSPGGDSTVPPVMPRDVANDARVDPVGARSNILFLPPVLLAFRSVNDGATGLAIGLAGAGALLLGAWLLREGLRAEAAFEARGIARRPALPRKMLAAAACGLGTAIAAFKVEPGVLAPAIYGMAALALHLGAFGLDPLKDKGIESDDFQATRVARVVDEAERYLTETVDAVRPLRDRALEARVDRFVQVVRGLIRKVERDPRDLTGARRYLGVYLMGARDAARKYAALATDRSNPAARADFEVLLDDLEDGFGRKTETLLLDDATDLTVEIEVLRDRLKRDGIRSDPGQEP